MLAFGASPLTAYHALFTSAYALTSTAVKAVPLLLVGAGICIALRANIGSWSSSQKLLMARELGRKYRS